MKSKDCLSDERLAVLHQKKRINAFFILYNRYQNYGCAIILHTLEKHKLVNALKEEKDAILYDSIMKALATFNKTRGTFRQLLSAVIANQTALRIREFKKDPLSDYISLDATFRDGSNLRFADSLTLASKVATPQDLVNLSEETKKLSHNYKGIYKRKIKKIVEFKEEGYSYQEIAKKLDISEKAVRAIFYRLKKRIDVNSNSKIKK